MAKHTIDKNLKNLIKMLDKSKRIWYNNYSKYQGEQWQRLDCRAERVSKSSTDELKKVPLVVDGWLTQ